MPRATATKANTETPAEPKAPALNLSTLNVSETSADKIKHTRKQRADYGQFPALLKTSHEAGTAHEVVIPKANAVEFSNMLRNAAKTVGLGVRRMVEDAGNGNVKVTFRGADKIERKAKTEETAKAE